MPQIFQVLRCYKCLVFQIHQTKKISKWECKMCGEKQSIKRHYGIGNGKECRLHVQKLNSIRGQTEEKINVDDSDEDNDLMDCKEKNVNKKQRDHKSKWSKYVEEEDDLQKENNSPLIENKDVSFEKPEKRRKTDFMRKEQCIGNAEYKGFELIAQDTAKNKIISALKSDIEIPIDNSTINYITSNNEKKELFSDEERNNQVLIQKISKWNKFVNTENDFKDEEEFPVAENVVNDHNIFECCDDSELDLILSI